jgi:diaminopimelate decarboxylase
MNVITVSSFDKGAAYREQVPEHGSPLDVRMSRGVLAWPTCDSIDLVAEDVLLPELQLGDLVVGHMMGAYTAATATQFNSLPKTKIVAVNSAAVVVLSIPSAKLKLRNR